MTQIPEDTEQLLTTYLMYARFKKENVAKSVQSELAELDKKVYVTYCSAFMYLSECYHQTLDEKDWTTAGEDELVEYSEFLCSVANDAKRIRKIFANLKIKMKLIKEEEDEKAAEVRSEDIHMMAIEAERRRKVESKINELMNVTYMAFNDLSMLALDHLSCIFLTFLFHDNDFFLEKSFASKWSQDLEALSDGRSDNLLMSQLMKELCKLLESKFEYLENTSFFNLCCIMANKIVVLYLTFLLEANKQTEAFVRQTGKELHQLRVDVASIKKCFESLTVSTNMSADLNDQLMCKLKILDDLVVLLDSPITSGQFVTLMHNLKDLSTESPELSTSLASLIEMCLDLRGETDRSGVPHRLARSNSLRVPGDKKTASVERVSSMGGIDSNDESTTISMRTTRSNSVVGGFFSRLSGGSIGSLRSTTSMTTNTEVSLTDQQQHLLEEDSMELENLELLKLVTFKRWMLDTVNDMRARGSSHAATTSSAATDELFAVHPLIQVFTDKYSSVDLRSKLLRSSVLSADKDDGDGGSRLSLMFSKGAGISAMRNGSAVGAATRTCTVEIKDVKVSNLAALNVKQTSQSVFLNVQVQGDAAAAASEVKMTLQRGCDDEGVQSQWVAEQAIVLPVCACCSNLVNVVLSLRYKGMLNERTIGSVSVPFNPFDPPTFAEKVFSITAAAITNSSITTSENSDVLQSPLISLSMSSLEAT